MSDIKFNCPQCGQHLTADARAAGTTVACPKCGQIIIVPQLARAAAKAEPPRQKKWLLGAAGVLAVVLLAAGVVIWQFHRRPTIQTPPAPAKASVGIATASSAHAFESGVETTGKTEAVEHSEDLNRPEDQAWLAWAKRLPISANPLPQIQDRNRGLTLKNFSDYPLFGPKGPAMDDVIQQAANGDCWFLADIAGHAAAHPDFIRKIVNDVGDGTYIVHYWNRRNHQQFVIRVNAQLWVDGSGKPQYAGIGPNHAIWPAILEKAYALTRRPPFNYEATAAGGEGASAFYIPTVQTFEPDAGSLPEPFPPKVVADWFNSGVSNCPNKEELIHSYGHLWFNRVEPNGPIKDAVDRYAIKRLKWFKTQLDAGIPVVVAAWGHLNNDTPVIAPNPVEIEKHLPRTDSYRTDAQHAFTVVQVPTDRNGTPIGVILRNNDAKLILDYTRVYFCLEAAATSTPASLIQFLPPSLETTSLHP